MLTDILFPAELQLRVDDIKMENETISIWLSSANVRSICPNCQTISERVHSNYNRHPADLPLAGYTVHLDMAVHRFFCDNGYCEAKTFTERIPTFIQHYARRTNRLSTRQQNVAIEAGGAIGQRVLAILDMPVNSDTLIRFIRNAPEPDIATPQVVGVDEWAKRKGQSYGTILVDLESHKAIDLLPDKSAESFAKWLREHPGVEIISRDRGSEYIKGAKEGAPDAIQVADRWHLLKNLRESLERWLVNKSSCLKAAANGSSQDEIVAENPSGENVEQLMKNNESGKITKESPNIQPKLTKAEKQRLERQEKRQERFEAVKRLHKQGLYGSEISRRLNLSRKTVSKYITADECPMYAGGRQRPSKLDPYIDYMTQLWEAGCHNASQIWREIQKRGFDGKRKIVARWAAGKRKSSQSSHSGESTDKLDRWSPRRASWLLVKQEDELNEDDRQALERMKVANAKVAKVYALGQRFTDMIREHQSEALLPWLDDVARSGIDTLKQFAKGIKQDLEAISNALCLPWSNGQTEGQVNRLKLIKRQMYGRANFDLLRRRVLARPLRC